MGQKTVVGLTAYFPKAEAQKVKNEAKKRKLSVSNYLRQSAGFGVLKQGSPTILERDQKELQQQNSVIELPTDFADEAFLLLDNLEQNNIQENNHQENYHSDNVENLLRQILANQKEIFTKLDKLSNQTEPRKNKSAEKQNTGQSSLFDTTNLFDETNNIS